MLQIWKNRIYPAKLQKEEKRKDSCIFGDRKQEAPGPEGKSGEGNRIILSMIWTRKTGETATEMRLINTETDIIFLGEKWIRQMEIETKRGPCADII